MIKFFKSLSIIIFLFTLVIGQSYAEDNFNESKGPKVAKVIVARAVVYADENLITALGYIPNGKLIYIGNPRKTNEEIVPTLISGRIAYIELKNIEYQDERIDDKNAKNGYQKEHNVDIILVKPEEKLNENNSLYFQLGRFDGGSNLNQTIYELEGTNVSWMTFIGSFFLHRPPLSRFFWGAGFEYSFIKSDQMNFQSYMFSPTFGYTFIRNVAFSVEAFGNLDISTSSSFSIDNNYSEDPSGLLWGPQIGVRVLSTPTTKYRLFGSLSYRSYQAFDLDNLKRTNPNDIVTEMSVKGLTQIKGISLSFGVGFDL